MNVMCDRAVPAYRKTRRPGLQNSAPLSVRLR
jgi:hypothetical protein